MGANSSVIPYVSVPVYDQLQTSRRPILAFRAALTVPVYNLFQTYGGRFRYSLPSYLTYFTTCSRRFRHGTGRTLVESSARRCPFSTPEQVRPAPRKNARNAHPHSRWGTGRRLRQIESRTHVCVLQLLLFHVMLLLRKETINRIRFFS